MAGRALAVCLALLFVHAAYGQTIVQGCGQGSCNPTATGGAVVADLKASSKQSSGGTDPLGFLGAILPPILARPGRRLQGHVPNMMLSEVDASGAELKGHAVSGQRKLLSTTATPHSNQASNSLRGLRKLQCADTDHQAECNAWGRSSCGLPGVNVKCPCMCGGGGASGSRPGGGDTTILVQPVAVGCLGNSCNPAAGGGSASGK